MEVEFELEDEIPAGEKELIKLDTSLSCNICK